MKKLVVIIVVALAVVGGAVWAFSATSGDSPRSARWAEPADYTYRVQYTIFGPGMGTYDITVRGHKVTEVERLAGTDQPEATPTGAEGWITVDNAWTLADLVDKYFEAKANPESDARIDYDSATGAPATISLDWIVDAIDDEEHFAILSFDPFPTVSAT